MYQIVNDSMTLIGASQSAASGEPSDDSTAEFLLRADRANCQNNEKAYMAIIITVLPLWAILTTLIVFILLSFHRTLRATKIFDNCTKQTAQFVYFVELRTGDTSSTYNRRRTTLTIDMFDDSQTTLARIAIPGYVIFGRKESPIAHIDDDKYYELRVIRLWLYRATKLRRVSTIRITHSCLETDARIMIYGLEIRSNDPDRYKSYYPVMNYISAYGCATKPNACFDLEPTGSISNIGGQTELSPISEHLSSVDYTLLVYLFGAIVFSLSTFDFLSGSSEDPHRAAWKGLILGVPGFFTTLIAGLVLRYLIKAHYSLRIGTGCWALVYYLTSLGLICVSTALWIYTAYTAYKYICPREYSNWILSICVGCVEALALTIVLAIVFWAIQALSVKNLDQFIYSDENGTHQVTGSKNKTGSHRAPKLLSPATAAYGGGGASPQGHQPAPQSWPPTLGGPYGGHPQPQQPLPPPQSLYGQPPPVGGPQLQPQPYMLAGQPHAYKVYPTGAAGQPPTANYPSYEAGGQLPTTPYYAPTAAMVATPAQQQQQQPAPAHHHQQAQTYSPRQQQQLQRQEQTYQQQTNLSAQGGKVKKIGSTESTGSNYYQQLMKNKGGVKSISQYGELLRQKKVVKR